MSEDEDYDVVIDVLQKRYDQLYKMTYRCCELEWSSIDFIRLDQMEQLTSAINMWKASKKGAA